jgi:hypothetical protein
VKLTRLSQRDSATVWITNRVAAQCTLQRTMPRMDNGRHGGAHVKAIAAFVFLAAQAISAIAAGPYDGVYQYGLSPAYYSVHQNGNTLLVVSLGSVPANGISFSTGPYVVRPATVDFWAYSIGAMSSANTARVSGIGIWGACNATTDVSFDGAGNAFATFVSATNTLLGTQQGVNCVGLYQTIVATVGTTLTLRKIF